MALLGYMMEPEDCTYINGSWSLNTDSWATHSTYGKLRGAFLGGGTYGAPDNYYIVRSFPSTKTTCCITAKLYANFQYGVDGKFHPFLGFSSGNTKILTLGGAKVGSDTYMTFNKWNSGTSSWDVLGTSPSPIPNTRYRYELMIENHGANARVRVWIRPLINYQLNYGGPHILVLDLNTVDTTVSGYANIDGFWVTSLDYQNTFICNVISADEPTHRYEVFPHQITGAGDNNSMATGTYASIDELNADTTDYVEADTAGDNILCTGASMPTFALNVVGVQISALASCGATGPTGAQLGIKSGGTEDWGATFLPAVGWTNISRLMTVNPVTGNPFTVAEVKAMQYGVKGV